ncbi:hypothetical protein ACLKA6_000410 [Drosophila palustris]
MMPMLANGSYLASKLPKATRFDAGRPTPKLPLSGSESEAEAVDYPDSDSSLTMSTNSISQISPGGNDDSKFMNVMTRFAEFTAKRASNTAIEEESISNDEKEFLAVLDRFPAFASGFVSATPKMSGSLDEISSKISSAPAWISQSAADCERSNKLKRFRIKNKLDTPYSRQSSIKPAENLHPLPAVSTLSTTLADVGAECHSNPASAKRKSSPPSPHGTPKTQKLVPQPYAGHGNSFALLTSLDDNDDMDVEVPANPFVDGTSCDASRSLGAPRSQDAPRTQVSPPRPTSPRPPPFFIAGLTGLREITALVKTVTNNFKIKNIGSSSARLTVEDGKTYREVQNLLQANEIPYNSWQPKEERSFRVVARGLHSDTDKQDISDDLTALDHKLSPPRVNVWDISSPDHPAHASSRPPHQPDHVSLSVDQDPSQWPVLGNPVTSGASSRPLSTAASSSPCGVSVLHQPAQERLLQQILSLQAAQQKDAHAQSSSVEKLLSRLDQMMALLMQVMGKSKLTSLLINDPPYVLDTTNDIDIAAEDLVEKIHTAASFDGNVN